MRESGDTEEFTTETNVSCESLGLKVKSEHFRAHFKLNIVKSLSWVAGLVVLADGAVLFIFVLIF